MSDPHPTDTTQPDDEAIAVPPEPFEVDDPAAYLRALDDFLTSIAEGERPLVPPCVRTTWQGSNKSAPVVTVCQHMLPRLAVLARDTGQGILVRPLSNITGSYQTATAASAGTHAAGGALDVDMRGLSVATSRSYETIGRASGLLFWWRPAVKGLWSDHGHMLDPSCPNLAKQAAAQFTLFDQGHNGLLGNGSDTGSRRNAAAIMAAFRDRFSQGQTATGGTTIHVVTSGETLSGIAVRFGTTVAKLQALNGIKDPDKIFVGQKIKLR